MDILLNPSSRWYYPLRILILFFLGLAIYYQTFTFGFVFDDKMFIVNDYNIKYFKEIHPTVVLTDSPAIKSCQSVLPSIK